jgi:hypothetical protein
VCATESSEGLGARDQEEESDDEEGERAACEGEAPDLASAPVPTNSYPDANLLVKQLMKEGANVAVINSKAARVESCQTFIDRHLLSQDRLTNFAEKLQEVRQQTLSATNTVKVSRVLNKVMANVKLDKVGFTHTYNF